MTVRDKALPLPDASSNPNAEASRPRTRARFKFAQRMRRHDAIKPPASKAAVADRSIWSESPASIKSLVEYTKAGDWVPGEQAEILEFFGKAYGYLIAVPVSAALYAIAWLLQRPGRFLLTCVVLTIVFLTM